MLLTIRNVRLNITRSFVTNFGPINKTSQQAEENTSLKAPQGLQKEIKEKYDIIVAGGGMVGCTMACALGKNPLFSHLKICLLESAKETDFKLKKQYSNRVVALNQNTKSLMSSLNVWKHIEGMRLQPVRKMQVWDAFSDAMITFSSDENMDADVAYIVENDVLLHAVNNELKSKEVKNVDVVYNAKVSEYKLRKQDQPHEVILNNGDIYSCKLLIGADGANSLVRKAMCSQYVSWNYDQMGVVATLYLAEEVDNKTAWQRFLPGGPVAFLPLNSGQSSLVWTTSVDNAKRLLKLSEEEFVDAINDAMWKQYPRNTTIDTVSSWVDSIFGSPAVNRGSSRQLPPSIRCVEPSSRAAFPLGFGHSVRYVAPATALIGDAAHRVHPLAGQGVNLGFGDVHSLTKHLGNALYSGLDLTHTSWLQTYETERQRHNVPTQLAIDVMQRLYSTDIVPLARALPLQLANHLLPLKRMLMSHASA